MRKLIELFNLETLEPNIRAAIQLGLNVVVYGALAYVLIALANMMFAPIIPELIRLSEYSIEAAKAICKILVFAFLIICIFNVVKYY